MHVTVKRLQAIVIAFLFIARSMNAQTVTVRVKFDAVPSLAQSAFADLKYNKNAVYNFEQDDRNPGMMNVLAFFRGGVAPVDGVTYPGKFFTDGCGNKINYRAAIAVNARGFYDGQEVDYAPQNLTNPELLTLAQNDFMPENHGYFHNMEGAYNDFGMTQETNVSECTRYIFEKTGIIPRVWVTPNDDGGYNSIVEAQQYMAATSQGVTDGYPTQPSNPDRTKFASILSFDPGFNVFKRDFNTDFWNDPTQMAGFKATLDELVAEASPSSKLLYRLATHGINDWDAFKDYIDHLEAISNDNIWVTSLQELLEYLEVKRLVKKTETISDNTLTILLDLSSLPPENHFMDMSLIINSDAAIASVSVEGADSYSFNNTGLINIFKKNHRSENEIILPVANAGEDYSFYLTENSFSLTGSASVANSRTESYEWRQISGPSSVTIIDPTNTHTEFKTSSEGVYVFRFKVTDDLGRIGIDDVTIKVKESLLDGNTLHIEAEDWDQMSGVQSENTSDAGGGKNVGYIDKGDWMDYEIFVASANTYQLALRVATPNSGAKLQIKDNSGAVISALVIPTTGGYQNWQTDPVLLSLPAGKQTIRIESASDAAWNINWLEFSVKKVEAPLTVNFSFFNAVCNGNNVDLLWKTAQEQNSKSFTVQKSIDGVTWSTIASLPAAGQSSAERSYLYSDKNVLVNSMYRVVEYDFNGKTTISSVVGSNCATLPALLLSPTVINNLLDIKLTHGIYGKVKIAIYDMNGRLMQVQEFNKSDYQFEAMLHLNSLSKGRYILAISLRNWQERKSFIKL